MLPSGWLAIEGIRVRCVIGVTERERQAPQELIVDFQVKVDFGKAAASDSIQDTVDYRALTRRVIEAGERSRFHLVESLATYLCRLLLDEFPSVEEIRIEIEKPHALSAARTVRAVASLVRS
jgi:dihydroneopterin aldolase